MAQAFARIRADLGSIDALIYNAGSGAFADVETISPEQFEHSWRVNAYGALLCAREVIPDMKARCSGSIVFIGATASRRGGPRSAAFAPAKAVSQGKAPRAALGQANAQARFKGRESATDGGGRGARGQPFRAFMLLPT